MTPLNPILTELYDLQRFAIKLGLDHIRSLSNSLGNPHLAYPVIHLAGTNGKGSTAFFLAQILRSMGLKTGLYTSPHLVDFRERIRVNETLISNGYIETFWNNIKPLVYEREATFFDVTTALAFDYFRHSQVDVAIIETGLGGRLDSTNIVKPELIVITPIDFDHEKQLGNSLSEIAAEKAGIFKENTRIISAAQEADVVKTLKSSVPVGSSILFLNETMDIVVKSADLEGTKFSLHDTLFKEEYPSLFARQPGEFQVYNIALAYLAARYYLNRSKRPFHANLLQKTLAENQWPGRLQIMQKNPGIIFDVSHNYSGIKNTIRFLGKHMEPSRLILLIGMVKDKNHKKIARFLKGKFKKIIITEPDTHRSLDSTILKKEFDILEQESIIIKDLKKAYDFSKKQLNSTDYLLVIGSHYLIGTYLSESN